MKMELETTDFGPCCSCEKASEDVRNIVMLEQKTTIPGSGWGCVQCGIPADGAVAVLCDDCVNLGRPIRFAIAGPVKDKKRVPIESLGAEHEHDMSKHPEVE
jgi:hypothetical protein